MTCFPTPPASAQSFRPAFVGAAAPGLLRVLLVILRPLLTAALIALPATLFAAVPPGATAPPAGPAPPVIDNVGAVRALSAEQAGAGLPVRLTGVLTYVDAARYMCFFRDDTGGLFVEVGTDATFRAGDRVRIEGRTAAGIFTPIIRPLEIVVDGNGALPTPRTVFLAELKSGQADADWVQIDARVRSVARTNGFLRIKLAAAEGTLLGWIPNPGDFDASGWVGAAVRMSGVCAGTFGPKNEALGFDLFGNDPGSVVVLGPPPIPADRLPLRPIRELGADWRNHELLRARCRGRVVFQSPERFLFIQDATGVVELRVEEPVEVAAGDRVEAIGFRDFADGKVILDSGTVRRLGSGPPAPAPLHTLREVYTRLGHGYPTSLDGHLAAVVEEPRIRPLGSSPEELETQPILVLKAGDWFFRAELPRGTDPDAVASLRPGSLLRLAGVVALEPTNPGEPRSFRLLLPSFASIRVLQGIPWWSGERLLGAAAGTAVAVLGGMGWIVGLVQRRRRQAERTVKENHEQTILHQSVLLEIGQVTRSAQEPAALRKVTELVARTLAVDRVGVWLFDEGGQALRCADLYAGGKHQEGARLPAESHPSYFAALASRRCLSASDARSDPGTREFTESYLVPHDIHSMLDVPFRLSGKLGGVLCLEQTGARRQWTVVEESFVSGVADQLTILMESRARAQAELSLRQAHADLELRVMLRTTELAEARDRAESADRLKSAFLATMSHELRTPLNSIIGFTGIMLQGLVGPLTPEQKKQLGMVMNSAKHLLSLINDVLDLSRIEAGQMEVRNALFDPRGPIDRAVQLLGPLAARKSLPIEIEAPPTPASIAADERRVEQILINLLANAVKFTETGRIRVAVKSDAGRTRLAVTDTGIGIEPGDLERIFKPFQQLDTGLTRQHEGTGLGLTICEKLARLMGGSISVVSTVGQGSTFTLDLPAAGAA